MLFLRAALILLLALGVVYASVYAYLRATCRDRIGAETAAIDKAILDARVRRHMARLRLPLALVVFGLPLAVLAVILFLDLL